MLTWMYKSQHFDHVFSVRIETDSFHCSRNYVFIILIFIINLSTSAQLRLNFFVAIKIPSKCGQSFTHSMLPIECNRDGLEKQCI